MTSLFPKGLGGHTKRYIYFSRLLSAILDQKISGIPQKYRLLAYRLCLCRNLFTKSLRKQCHIHGANG